MVHCELLVKRAICTGTVETGRSMRVIGEQEVRRIHEYAADQEHLSYVFILCWLTRTRADNSRDKERLAIIG
jgi:hypothetical protein